MIFEIHVLQIPYLTKLFQKHKLINLQPHKYVLKHPKNFNSDLLKIMISKEWNELILKKKKKKKVWNHFRCFCLVFNEKDFRKKKDDMIHFWVLILFLHGYSEILLKRNERPLVICNSLTFRKQEFPIKITVLLKLIPDRFIFYFVFNSKD